MCLRSKMKKAGLTRKKDGCGSDRNEKCFSLSLYLCIYRPFNESFDCVDPPVGILFTRHPFFYCTKRIVPVYYIHF